MKKLLPLLFILTTVFSSRSQSIANYAAARNTGIAYTSIMSSGNSFSWRNVTSATADDNRSFFTPIGFDFWYDGVRYTQFSVSTNGYLDFSSATADGGPLANAFGYDNTAFTNSNASLATRPAIAAFYDDITTQGTVDPLNSCVKYLLTGSAPNRTLTVEWMNMTVYSYTLANLNFQVQLVEGSGVIGVNYGNMSGGTYIFSYGTGINAATVSTIPSAAQLKMLQAVNGIILNNTIKNNLATVPQSNSNYVFTPPIPANPPGTLSFSGVSSSGMTVNWSDWATNENGYVIYNSTDGINYNFVTQTLANATSAAVTGLFPGTMYYWQVYAVTEGCLSVALSGTKPTSAAGVKTSAGSGNWSAASTWSPSGVPSLSDNVTIANGHSVSINTNGQCNNIVIGQGGSGVLQFNNGGTAYTLTVNNMTVNAGGTFWIPTNSNATSSLTVKGNIVNNGTLNLASDPNSLVSASFTKNGNQTISGTGTGTFYTINVDMGTSASNTLDISLPTFTAASNFLTIKNGTFKLTSSNTATLIPFTATAVAIPSTAGLHLNTTNTTHSISAGLTLNGALTLQSGTVICGTAANKDLLISGGQVNVSGGALSVGGKLYASGVNDIAKFSISNGTITVPTFSSTNTSIAPFNLTGAGSSFNMSGGRIIIPREGGTGSQHLGYINTVANGAVSGGTLQLGTSSTPAAQTITIKSPWAVGNLQVNSVNATAILSTNSLSVISDVAITAGTLNANNLNISLGGNWTSAGSFTPGTSLVTFNSSSPQYISKTGGETFNHLLFSGTGIKTFSSAVTTSGNFSIAASASVDVSPPNNQLTVKGNYLNNGYFNCRTGLVYFNGVSAQTIGGSSITNFYDMTLGNSSGASLVSPQNLLGTLTLTMGVFNTNSQVFTMVSTATACARIAAITGSGDITGNVTVQRFAPGGTTGWALFGTPISSALTLNDWDDDIFISCSTCPDGSAGGFLSIYTYDETVNGLYDNYLSYIPLNTINDPILSTKGYWVYLGNGQYTTTDITLDVTGTVRKFNYTIPLDYTNYGSAVDDGWNLIQNPYPSPISWSALKGTTSNIDNAIYIYNTDLNGGSGGYATYINGISSPPVASGGVGNTIPMSQSFYVHSTGATALNATESVKVAGNPAYLKTTNSNNTSPFVRIHLQNAAGFNDETVLYTQSGATSFFDYAYDAYKMRGQDPNAPSVALEKGTDLFQVNGVAPINGNFSIPLKTLTGYAGTYTLSASGFSTFPAGACITLFDKFTNVTTNIKTTNYVFYLSDTTTVARFNLNITVNPLTINASVTQPVCQVFNSGKIIASAPTAGPWNYYWTTAGTPVKTSLNKATADTLNNLSGGIYDLEMTTSGMCDDGNSSYQIISQAPVSALFASADTLDLTQSTSITFTNLSSSASSYIWNFGDGSGVSTVPSPTHYYNGPGIYTVQLISTGNSGCSDTVWKVITVILNVVGVNSNGTNASQLLIKTVGNNEFVFEQTFNEEHSFNLRLIDAQGRLINDYGNIISKNLNLPVDLRNLSPGIYFMKITFGQEQKVIKLPVK